MEQPNEKKNEKLSIGPYGGEVKRTPVSKDYLYDDVTTGAVPETILAKTPPLMITKAAPAYETSSTGAARANLREVYDLVPYEEISCAYMRVAEFGAKKYAPWNWSKGLPRVQLLASLLRHCFKYLRGEDRDHDSGLLHTDHILWNAAALSHNVHHSMEDGRRPDAQYLALKATKGKQP